MSLPVITLRIDFVLFSPKYSNDVFWGTCGVCMTYFVIILTSNGTIDENHIN